MKRLQKFSSAILLVTFLFLVSCEKAPVSEATLRGGETRETLSPAFFTGKAAYAYKSAKEIPQVLDSLYCYCDCAKHYAHKSLLTCFVTTHGEHCDVCMDEAIMAYELHKEGKDILTIRRMVDAKYSR